MNRKEKMEVLVAFLTGNNIEHWEDVKVESLGIEIPLYIPRFNISVKTEEHNDEWYQTVKRYTRPVFIRDDESADFIIEKVRNTMRHPKGFIPSKKRKWLRKNMIPAHKYCVHHKKRHRKRTAIRKS